MLFRVSCGLMPSYVVIATPSCVAGAGRYGTCSYCNPIQLVLPDYNVQSTTRREGTVQGVVWIA